MDTKVPVVQKFKLGEEPKAYVYWLTQPYSARLSAVEELRQAYHGWETDPKSRLQRVYRIFKRP